MIILNHIHINELRQIVNQINLIDIREELEFHSLPKLGQAKHIPMGQLVSNPEQYLLKDESYYLICRSGYRTEQVAQYLLSLGYDVINVQGGMLAYYK